jgi:Cdc6-like AAA superfamily ATPase
MSGEVCMAYKVDFRTVVDRVIQYSDIALALRSATAGIDEMTLRLNLLKREADVLTQAASQIAAYNEVEARILKDINTLLATAPTLSPRIQALTFEQLTSPNSTQGLTLPWTANATSSAGYTAGVQPQLVVDRFMSMVSQAVGGNVDVMAAARATVSELQLDTADQRLNAARTAADEGVFRVLLQYAIQVINDSGTAKGQQKIFVTPNVPDPGAELTLGRALSEVFDSSTEIVTKAKTDLERLVNSMQGGSIGIAGPRGVGKTTLLRTLGRTSAGADDARTLSVYTSAPVEYEARDFQLHIFSSLCLEVLAREGQREVHQIPFEETENRPRATHGRILFYAAFANRVLMGLGGLGIFFGILIASLVLLYAHQVLRVPVATQPTVASPLPLSSRAVSRDASPPRSPQMALASSPPTAATPEPLKTDLEDFGLRSGDLIRWGAVAILLGFLVRFFQEHELLRERSEMELRHTRSQLAKPLVVEAQRALTEIRFQRSYTTGWAGALKVIPGAELSVNEALSLAQKQETLPEMVENFREFAQDLTNEESSSGGYKRVIIAIDELDKLESDEKAEQFLNDIKSIFSIPKFIYLVSVSESAISNFERRGIAFRDAFDSTFDDIYYVDYLSVDDSIKLLNQRVTNLPLSFGYICHALSAGLPRDLIRVARAMLQFAQENPTKNDIVSVATALIERDVRSKIRAVSIAARRVDVQPESSEFFIWLGGLKVESMSLATPSSEQDVLLARETEVADNERTELALLNKSVRELQTFLRYAAAFKMLFTRAYSPGDSGVAPFVITNATWVDDLAKVRQGFETSFGTAQSRLDALKREYCL